MPKLSIARGNSVPSP